jgi:hypothetical protein
MVMDFLIVLTAAAAATGVSKFINKTINKKNEEEIERRKERIREISELSKDALDLGDKKMYYILQKQGNEVYHRLFVAIFLDAVYEITPHFFGLVFIHSMVPDVSLSFGFMTFGMLGSYLLSVVLVYASLRMYKRVRR